MRRAALEPPPVRRNSPRIEPRRQDRYHRGVPKTTFPRDRFDDLPSDAGRVGAHRAENPRLNGWIVFFWAALATVLLVAVGIFGTLVATGRVELFPVPENTAAATPDPTVTPVVDTTYAVNVLNATPEDGLATEVKDLVVAAGWAAGDVLASEASATDFAETTVYYAADDDEAAAAGLADAIGGALIAQSDAYAPADDPDTEADESAAPLLTIVVGLDRVAAEPSATP